MLSSPRKPLTTNADKTEVKQKRGLTSPSPIERSEATLGGVVGAVVGLFLARVALETADRPWPWLLVIAIALLAALIGFVLGRWFMNRDRALWPSPPSIPPARGGEEGVHPPASKGEAGMRSPGSGGEERLRPPARGVPIGVRWRRWPALLLLIYVLWPRRDPLVAVSVAALALLAWLLNEERCAWAATPTGGIEAQPPLNPPRGQGGGGIAPPREQRGGRSAVESLADGVVFAAALVVYTVTVAPDVLPADFGEFQLVAARLGVAHPPGFPLYTLSGHLFIHLLPWGTPAYRLNLMSGVLAAGTLVFVARATRLWARRLGASPAVVIAGGLAAALTLGSATTFWAQATIANVRTPAAFFAAVAFYLLARFAAATDRHEADRVLMWLSLTLGLAGGHYPPLAFIGLFFVAYVLAIDPHLAVQPRRWWRPLLLGSAALLLPLAYLPIRGAMGAPLAPDNLASVEGFLQHFLARGFFGDMFAFANAADLPHRLVLLPTLFRFQFNVVLLVVASLGLLGLLWRDWRLFVLLAGGLALHTFVTITYRAPQTVEYLMPAYPSLAIAVGLLPSLIGNRARDCEMQSRPHTAKAMELLCFLRSRTSTLVCALALWAAFLNGWSHAPSFIELASDYTARESVGPLLERAPVDALILADWRWATPLWYLQQVEGVRPDVEVQYVYPVVGEEYRESWWRRVREAGLGRSVLLTHFYEFPGYTAEPWGTGFLLRPRPVAEPRAPLVLFEETFGGQVQLVGYSIRGSESRLHHRFYPGQVAEIVLAWRATEALDVSPSFTLRLVDGEGRSRSQADQALSTDCVPGEVRFERLSLPLYPFLPAGRYRMTLGAYVQRGPVNGTGFETLPAGSGQADVALTELELVPRGVPRSAERVSSGSEGASDRSPRMAPFTLHRRWVPFAGGPRLVGVDYDRSVSDVLRVYLHWQGPFAGGQGDVWQVRVRVEGESGMEAVAPLYPIPSGAYQSVVVDLPEPGRKALRLALIDAQGEQRRGAGPWGWSLEELWLSASSLDVQFVPLGDEMAVVGATARPAGPGKTMAVDVRLVALRPLTTDDATSVRLTETSGRWLARHDMQPALSAVPTLKWIRGSQVLDRHLLMLPEDVAAEVQATLVAYERFRLTALPPMDGRFSEVPLGTYELDMDERDADNGRP